MNWRYQGVPREIIKKKTAGHFILECDEMWSFVGKKYNKQWVWLALDRDTREIVGVNIGRRDAEAAQMLWASLPPAYRERAVCYTDFWEAYRTVIPPERHHAVGKESGQTNHIERFNCTLRQRASGLVRKTLSSQRSSRITLARSGTSFVTTMRLGPSTRCLREHIDWRTTRNLFDINWVGDISGAIAKRYIANRSLHDADKGQWRQ